MHFQLFSDLHTEWADDSIIRNLDFNPLADFYVFAGDIGTDPIQTRKVLESIIDPFKLIYIPGNHEFYGMNFETVEKTGLHTATFKIVKDGHLIVGNPLWSHIPDYLAEEAKSFTNDFSQIRRMTAKIWNKWHKEALLNLKRAINSEEGNYQRLTVITHYAPLYSSINKDYIGKKSNCMFANALEDFFEEFKPTLWLHGHLHDSCCYDFKGCRIYCNPRGYPHMDINPDFHTRSVIGAGGQYI